MEYLKLLGSEETSQEPAILRDRTSLSIEETEARKTSQQPQEPAFGADQSGYYQPQPHEGYAAPSDSYQQHFSGSYGEVILHLLLTSKHRNKYLLLTSKHHNKYLLLTNKHLPSSKHHNQPPPSTASSTTFFLSASTSATPNITPTQTPQVPLTSFPPAIVAQPTVHSFAPSSPPLRNVEKYQQATLGAQLYPGVANPAYQTVQPSSGPLGPGSVGGGPSQMGSFPGHTMSQAPALIPLQRPFMPTVNNNAAGFSQRPAMGASMQAPSPA